MTEFKPIKVDGTLRFARGSYHAKCPDGKVIPCVAGWMGDMLDIPVDAYTSGTIGHLDENEPIRQLLLNKFPLDNAVLQNLQDLNDQGEEQLLQKKLVEYGIIDPQSNFRIKLVNLDDPITGVKYTPLDRSIS